MGRINSIVSQIHRAVSLLHQPGDVVELRCLNTGKGTISGYFDDFEKLASAAASLSGKVPAVYITLNPVNPALLARAHNQCKTYARETTSDGDIVARRWLPLDFDPVRPSGISSTDAEHEAALKRARQVREWLRERGWPDPIYADSGNGAHLLYRIDLPNDEETRQLLERALQAVAFVHGGDGVEIDVKVFNAARIWKVYGTLSCKGDNTPERPHRLARIIEAPDAMQVVSREKLQALAGILPKPEHFPSGKTYQPREEFDLEKWIQEHNLPVVSEKSWNGGRVWILTPCPWNPEHTNKAAYIVQFPNGAIAAGCHHNSCQGKGWHELRDIYEPGWREKQRDGLRGEEDLAEARKRASEAVEAAKDNPGAPFIPEALSAFAVLQKRDPAAYETLRAELKKAGVRVGELDKQVRRFETQSEAGKAERHPAPMYEVVDGVICRVQFNERGGTEYIPLCGFEAKISAEEIRDDGADRPIFFVIEGRLPTGERLSTAKVDAASFSGMNWVTKEWGNRAVVYAGQSTKDHLRAAIQILSGEVPRRTVFLHTGWRNVDGRWLYLHAGGAIGAEGPVEAIEVELEGVLRDYLLPEPPDGDEAREAIRTSLSLLDLAPERITAPLLGAVYLAPLGEAVKLDLSVFLTGKTGVFKTAATALAQAHWGKEFADRHLPGNWSSTANALERQAFLIKDAVFVVDDFAPKGAHADVQRLHQEADRLLRGQGNRSGRARLRSDASMRPEYFPRGIVISSGEDVPQGHSLRARVCILDVGPGDIDVQRLTEAQEKARQGMLAKAMAAYIRWLAPQMDELQRTLPARRLALREQGYKEGLHRRIPDQAAALLVAWETFLAFAYVSGAVTEDERNTTLERVRAGLDEVAAAQAEYQRAEDPVDRFLSLLAAAIASGRAHVADAKDGKRPKDASRWGWQERWIGVGDDARQEWHPQGECIGWLEDPNLYLEPEASYAVAQRLARDQNASLPVSARTLWKRLAERKLLTAADAGKNTTKRMVMGERRRVVSVHMGICLREMGAMGAMGDIPCSEAQKNAPIPSNDEIMGAQNGGSKVVTSTPKAVPEATAPIPVPPFSGANEKWGRKTAPKVPATRVEAPDAPIAPKIQTHTPYIADEEIAAGCTEREEGIL